MQPTRRPDTDLWTGEASRPLTAASRQEDFRFAQHDRSWPHSVVGRMQKRARRLRRKEISPEPSITACTIEYTDHAHALCQRGEARYRLLCLPGVRIHLHANVQAEIRHISRGMLLTAPQLLYSTQIFCLMFSRFFSVAEASPLFAPVSAFVIDVNGAYFCYS